MKIVKFDSENGIYGISNADEILGEWMLTEKFHNGERIFERCGWGLVEAPDYLTMLDPNDFKPYGVRGKIELKQMRFGEKGLPILILDTPKSDSVVKFEFPA